MSISSPLFPELSKEAKQYFDQRSYRLTPEDCESLIPHLLNNTPLGESTPPAVELFFRKSTLKQLAAQEKLFKENMANPIYQRLLFATSAMLSQDKPYEKVALLLKWGWNPNQVYIKPPHRESHTLYWAAEPHNATVLHAELTPRICELLVENGANTKALCQINSRYQALLKEGITEIKTDEELARFIKLLNENPEVNSNAKSWYSEYKTWTPEYKKSTLKYMNIDLAIAQKMFTPYELALHFQQKSKYKTLRQYEPQEDLQKVYQNKFEAIEEQINNNKLFAARKLLLAEMKTGNPYVLEQIERLKPIIDQEVLFVCVRNNYGPWVKAIVENGWVEKEAVSKIGNKETLLMCATTRNRPTLFKYLDAQGYTHGIEEVVNSLNENMDAYAKDWEGNQRTPEEVLTNMPTGIIYYLAKKGYTFHNDKIMAFVIGLEKDKLEENISQLQPVEDKPVKKFKL